MVPFMGGGSRMWREWEGVLLDLEPLALFLTSYCMRFLEVIFNALICDLKAIF